MIFIQDDVIWQDGDPRTVGYLRCHARAIHAYAGMVKNNTPIYPLDAERQIYKLRPGDHLGVGDFRILVKGQDWHGPVKEVIYRTALLEDSWKEIPVRKDARFKANWPPTFWTRLVEPEEDGDSAPLSGVG